MNNFTSLVRHKVRRHLPAFLGYVVIVSASHWPLLLHINSHVIGRPFEDVFEVLWQLRWMRSAVFKQHVFPFYTPDIFYPQGWYIASGAQPGWYLLAFSGLTYWLGAVTTYNVVQLSTFVVAGFGVYLLVHHVTQSRVVSLVAGCIYITAPVLTVRLGGHLHTLLGMQWLPYTTLFTMLALEKPDRSAKLWAPLAGFVLALAILGSWYFLFMATLPLMGLFFTIRTSQPWQRQLVIGIVIGLVCMAVLFPFAYLTFQARAEMFGGNAHFSLVGSDTHSLSVDRLLVPNPLHSLWGEASQQAFTLHGEQDMVSVGYVAIILALLGMLKLPTTQSKPFISMAAVSLILGMGTTLHWNSQRVEISAPRVVEQVYQRLNLSITPAGGHIVIPLPGLLLYRFLPFYDAMRVWARFDITFMLSIAVLAGLGGHYLAHHLAKKIKFPNVVILSLGLIILVEGLVIPYKNFTPVSINARRNVVQWLESQPEGTAIIEYPRPFVGKIAMYNQSLHGQRVVNGYMSHMPDYLRAVETELGKWPNPKAIPILRNWHVKYVLVSGTSQEEFQATLSEINALAGLCHVRSFNEGFLMLTETHVFRVLQPGEVCRN